jgi:histidinol-phosphate aminotransferase
LESGEYLLLDYNEAFSPLPRSVVVAIRLAAARLNLYPDASAADLTSSIAEKLGVANGQVLVGCGSLSILHAVFALIARQGGPVAFTVPPFVEYPRIAAAEGCQVIGLSDVRVEALERYCREVTAGGVVICNPDNPTGRMFTLAELARIVSRLDPNSIFILDEAYVEYSEGLWPNATLSLLDEFPNVVVLRTFSKAFGLAGLRIGYSIGSVEMTDRLRRTHLSFAASAIAQAAALACFDSAVQSEIERRLHDLSRDREILVKSIAPYVAGVTAAATNFVFVETVEPASDFVGWLRSERILVSEFGPHSVRITIPSPAGTAALCASLQRRERTRWQLTASFDGLTIDRPAER